MKIDRVIALLCCMLLWCGIAKADPKWINKHTEAYFGTVTVMRLHAEPDTADRIWQEITDMLGAIEASVSIGVDGSDINRFNALLCGEGTAVNDTTAAIMLQAKELYAASCGWFDPTVYPLVDLWGFSPRFNTNRYKPSLPYDRAKEQGTLPLPDPAWIKTLLPLVGFEGVELRRQDDGWYLYKHTPDVTADGVTFPAQLDLGGIAKGYACDRTKEILQQYGCTDGYFSCGGSSMAVLSNCASETDSFALGLKKPRQGSNNESSFGTLYVKDICLSTSNDASSCWYSDGVIYAHIIDPHTGWPVNTSDRPAAQQGIISVTLFAPSAAYCDAMTTALMLMGPQQATAWLNAHPDHQAVMVCQTGDGLRVMEHMLPGQSVVYSDDAYRPY